jgi:hypothetical protein
MGAALDLDMATGGRKRESGWIEIDVAPNSWIDHHRSLFVDKIVWLVLWLNLWRVVLPKIFRRYYEEILRLRTMTQFCITAIVHNSRNCTR